MKSFTLRHRVTSLSVALALSLLSVLTPSVSTPSGATPVDPITKSCLDKSVGKSVANKIVAAKKWTTKQKAQVKKCTTTDSSSGASDGSTSTTGLKSLTWGLLWSVGSNQAGLGNVSDPALLQLTDGSIRMFFKNGNETQAQLTGFDNKIHSYVSTDNGKTWTLESGVRVDIGAPISVGVAVGGGYEVWGWVPVPGGDVFTRFTSSDGKDFTKGSGNSLSLAACKSVDGTAAVLLGDMQVVKTASGYLAYGHDMQTTGQAPWKRHACALTSTDGTTWTLDASKTVALPSDIQTNPETYRNRSNVIEQILPIDKLDPSDSIRTGMQIRTSTNDGASWTELSEVSFWAADPDRLDIANGDSLLAYGSFDHRKGGLLAVTKKIDAKYKAKRQEKGIDTVIWTISGATKDQIIIKNLCLNQRAEEISTATVKYEGSGSNWIVTFTDSKTQMNGCVWAIIGVEQAIH